MASQRIALSGTEEAFVALVLEEHTALIRNADQKRDSRMAVLLREKAIPEGVVIQVEKGPGATIAELVFEIADPPPDDSPAGASEVTA